MRFSWKGIWSGVVYSFAAIGFIFVSMFFAIRFHLTDVSGKVDERSAEFERQAAQAKVLGVESDHSDDADTLSHIDTALQNLTKRQELRRKNLCMIKTLGQTFPADASRIWFAAESGVSDVVVFKMLTATKNSLPDQNRFDNLVEQCSKDAVIRDEADFVAVSVDTSGPSVFAWSNDEEWASLAQAVSKDKEVIDRVSQVVGIEPRLIVSSLVVEQIRLFHSQRELFKKFFEPLKILGNSTVISLGVMGIKPTTAQAVEEHLHDASSPYYLGTEYEHVLDYPAGVDVEKERFNRLTDDKNRYYLYLYGGLYIKQMLHQWQVAGYDMQYRPEIVGTLFNVGFPQSHPNPHPQAGGSAIRVGEHEYSFGRLAYEFYYSGQLLDVFPYDIK